MNQAHALSCLAPADPQQLAVRATEWPRPGRGEILVEQLASSINPIDAKRASGYGRRLLSLRGAHRFPLILGNDVVGIVKAYGPGVSDPPPGTLVFGVLPTGREGAHSSHVAVPRRWLRAAPPGCDVTALATLPYSFTTMWLALRGAGLDARTTAGRKVLVNGASGALGHLALRVLHQWGARMTAVASHANLERCRALGASELVARERTALQRLPTDFAAVLNFGSWEDDRLLSARLAHHALGHATTVHPLLGNFDRHGWLRGALANRQEWSEARSRVASRSPSARYAWTVFRPDAAALDALAQHVASGLVLPVGWTGSPEGAAAGFAHVAAGGRGRAVLRFSCVP